MKISINFHSFFHSLISIIAVALTSQSSYCQQTPNLYKENLKSLLNTLGCGATYTESDSNNIDTINCLGRLYLKTETPITFSNILRALIQIDDPGAIPYLLEKECIRDDDVFICSDSAIQGFKERGIPYLESCIASWETLLKIDSRRLQRCVFFSKEYDSTRLTTPRQALFRKLSSELVSQPNSWSEKLTIVQELVEPLGRNNAEELKDFFNRWLQVVDKTKFKLSPELINQNGGEYLVDLRRAQSLLITLLEQAALKFPEEIGSLIWNNRLFFTDDDLLRTAFGGQSYPKKHPQEDLKLAEVLFAKIQDEKILPPLVKSKLTELIGHLNYELLFTAGYYPASAEEAANLALYLGNAESHVQKQLLKKIEPFLISNPTSFPLQQTLSALYGTDFIELTIAFGKAYIQNAGERDRQWLHTVFIALTYAYLNQGKLSDARANLIQAQSFSKYEKHSFLGFGSDDYEEKFLEAEISQYPDPKKIILEKRHIIPWPEWGHFIEKPSKSAYFSIKDNSIGRWDIKAKEGSVVYQNNGKTFRDFKACDNNLLVVATDDSLSLFKDNSLLPVWTNPFILGGNSYFSVSNSFITAADEKGNLVTFDTMSGEEHRRNKVIPMPMPTVGGGAIFGSHRGLVRQIDGKILIPNTAEDPSSFDLIEGKSGNTLWKFSYSKSFVASSLSKNSLYLVAKDGEVLAVNLKDGKMLWNQSNPKPIKHVLNDYSASILLHGDQLVVSREHYLVAYKIATGDKLWDWGWSPNPSGGKITEPQVEGMWLTDDDDFVYAAVPWFVEPNFSERNDVVKLSSKGQVVSQETSPWARNTNHGTEHIFIFAEYGKLFLGRGSSYEIWTYLK